MGDLVKIQIDMPDLESESTSDLAMLAANNLKIYIGNEVVSNNEDSDEDLINSPFHI